MSYTTRITIICDGYIVDKCEERQTVITSSIIVARYMLKEHHGWSHVRGYTVSNDRDYCPDCTRRMKNNDR